MKNQFEQLSESLKDIKVPPDISPEIQACSAFKVEFTHEEMAADDRLAYILGK